MDLMNVSALDSLRIARGAVAVASWRLAVVASSRVFSKLYPFNVSELRFRIFTSSYKHMK